MALQKTAYDACSRKVHCVSKKYLDDPFACFFVRDQTIVNSPLMNRGTWLRTTCIVRSVESFSKQLNGEPFQLVSFGAGVDTLYFRIKKNHPDMKISAFVELDLPDLIANKGRVVERHSALKSLVGPEYVLLECDLCKTDEVAEKLKEILKPGVPTIILAEMVFVYLPFSVSTDLLKKTLHNVVGIDTNVLCISYDAMGPSDRFGRMMVSNLSAIGADLKGINDLPDTKSHENRCKSVGFQSVRAVSMKELYLTVPKETQAFLNSLEMIDDWDEWGIVHDHYCFVLASTKLDGIPSVF